MTVWPQNIARKAVVALTPYSARGGATGALHLDANECPWAPPPLGRTEGFNRYPAQQPEDLRLRLAGLYGVGPNQIMMGRGADEGIEVLVRSFCEAGRDAILICPPTFGYYETCARIQGADVITAPLKANFDLDAVEIRAALAQNPQIKIVFLCSPNNPTGTLIDKQMVLDLCRDFPDVLIVVDEAYQEFSGRQSFAEWIEDKRNLVVLRTLSKAYALAGARFGVTLADKRVIDLMLKVLPPYPLARPVMETVKAALSPSALVVAEDRLRLWTAERERMTEALKCSPFVKTVWPSAANFLLLEVRDVPELLQNLARYQIKIRDFRKTLPGHFRLSIGTPEENDLALRAFGIDVPAKRPARTAEVYRTTKETDIAVRLNLDKPGDIRISTGIGFYDHMLEALARHGGFSLTLACKGDLEVDAHHSIEDCALALGQALAKALGNKAGAGRFGFVMPMDEAQARIAIDLSGRPALRFEADFPQERVGDFPSAMCRHFFESLSQTLGAAIHIEVEGQDTHHMIEACFKGVGRALAQAIRVEGHEIASTKGVL